MVTVQELLRYVDSILQPDRFQDFCPNGLQVEGCQEIERIVTGVTACQALLDRAIEEKADLVLVHHGYFWHGESPVIVGMKRKRLEALLSHRINLAAYHLPLDAHSIYGNNVQLAKRLKIDMDSCDFDQFDECNEHMFVLTGRLQQPMTPDAFSSHVTACLDRAPLHIAGASERIETVAWCAGSGSSLIEYAIEGEVDAYITGEIPEKTVHVARESGLHLFAAGHHATERYGVQALGEHLSEWFGISHCFVDIDNPV